MGEPHPKIADSVLDLVGSTPMVRLARVGKRGAAVVGKLEVKNPGASVKDRPALALASGASLGAASFTNYLAGFPAAAALLWSLSRRPRGLLQSAAMFGGLAPFLASDFYVFVAQRGSRIGQFEPFAWAQLPAAFGRAIGGALLGGLPLYIGGVYRVTATGLLALLLGTMLSMPVLRWRRVEPRERLGRALLVEEQSALSVQRIDVARIDRHRLRERLARVRRAPALEAHPCLRGIRARQLPRRRLRARRAVEHDGEIGERPGGIGRAGPGPRAERERAGVPRRRRQRRFDFDLLVRGVSGEIVAPRQPEVRARIARESGLEPARIERLLDRYGDRIDDLLELIAARLMKSGQGQRRHDKCDG